MGVMDNNIVLELLEELIAQLIPEFLHCRRTVEARGDQKGDLDVRAAFPEFADHIGQNIPAGNRSCVIADDDDTVFFSFCQFTQPGAVDRIFHRLADDFNTCPVTGKLIHFAGQDWCVIRYLQILCCVRIKKFDCFHRSFAFLLSVKKRAGLPQPLFIQQCRPGLNTRVQHAQLTL